MKLVSYWQQGSTKLGAIVNDQVYALQDVNQQLPNDINAFLRLGVSVREATQEKLTSLLEKSGAIAPVQEYQLMAPVPHPTSCRDGYAFRQHVEAARRNRGVDMIQEFDQYPIFYFTNHNAIQGPGPIYCMPDHFQQLDFELEIAIVIGKEGKNINAKDADEYIAGFTIMNDLSARKLQMEEMLLNLGPAKKGHVGNNYNLSMKCWVNDQLVSEGNVKDMDWTFAEIIERCSYGVTIYPGDVIGSGTVGTGCFLELNGTGKFNDANYTPQWLQPNDVVTMSIDGLGTLENTIYKEDTDWSILSLKK